MSSSMYLTIYFRNKFNESNFRSDLEKARRIFRVLWTIEGTGFDKNGNIEGLSDLYYNCDWDSDGKDAKNDNGELSIIKLHTPDLNPNVSFNFHNYSRNSSLSETVELDDIYILFAEILSSCFGYVVKVSGIRKEIEYKYFFDEDGEKYIKTDSRNEYIDAIQEMDESEQNIKVAKETLNKAKKILSKYKKNKK